MNESTEFLILACLACLVAVTPIACWMIHDLWLLPRWRQQAVNRNWSKFYEILQNETAEARQIADGVDTGLLTRHEEFYTVFGKKILHLPDEVWNIENHVQIKETHGPSQSE